MLRCMIKECQNWVLSDGKSSTPFCSWDCRELSPTRIAAYKKINDEKNKYVKVFEQKYENTSEKSGVVYCIGYESGMGPVKIGYTSNDDPIERLKSLQTGNPEKLVLLCFIKTENPKQTELEIHDVFSDVRIRGEWFDIDHSQIKKYFSEKSIVVNFIDDSDAVDDIVKIIDDEILFEKQKNINTLCPGADHIGFYEDCLSKTQFESIP